MIIKTALITCAAITALLHSILASSTESANLIVASLKLRSSSLGEVVIDPDIITTKLLDTGISIDANSRGAVVSQLRAELEPRGLSVIEQDGIVWVTKSRAEPDLSRQIALVITTSGYQQLSNSLASEVRGNPDARLMKLQEMASFMAEQSKLPATTQRLIASKSDAIRSLQYHQKNAIAGSSLSPPDPARAQALESDIEGHRDEVRRHYARLSDHLMSSVFNPAEPATAPTAVYGVHDIVPPVVFNKLALDSMLFYTESLEALTRASTALGFSQSDEETQAARRIIETIRKGQIDNKALIADYLDSLRRAGLLAGDGASKQPQAATIGVDAANKLYTFFEDKREAVRIAIGKNIMKQLDALVSDVKANTANFIRVSGATELFLLGENELELANSRFGDGIFRVQPYDSKGHSQLGAITGLVAFSRGGGETSTISVQLEPSKSTTGDASRSLQNLFGSREKVVQLNTTADLALVDDMLMGKGGAAAVSANAYFGEGGFIGSVGESLDLIKNTYDPALFKSSIIIGLDSNYDIKMSGPSGGVAIALAALSRVRSKGVDKRIMVTGALRQFGDVRPVGGIYGKGIAALDAGALVLAMPSQNLGEIMNLPAGKLLTRHTIALTRFQDAASLAGLDMKSDSRGALEGICLYNFALLALGAKNNSASLSLSSEAARVYPEHLSAQLLKAVLLAAGTPPALSADVSEFLGQAQAFANVLVTNPMAIAAGTTKAVPVSPSSVLAAIIPDFTVTSASGDDAFDALNNKAKLASGQAANITIRTRNTYFTNQFINLSIQGKTVQEILKELCDICEAKYEVKGSAIVVDSSSSPVATDLGATVIPEFSVEDMNAEQAFNHLADMAEQASGSRPNFVIRTKTDFLSKLSINLSLQRQTFKTILTQLCEICDAKVEQRGDSYFITVPE